MAERLVQPADLERYPQLLQQGISVNMNYDFSDLEASEANPDKPPVVQVESKHKAPAKKAAPKKAAKKK